MGTQISAFFATAAVAVAGLLGAGSDHAARRTAIVIDAHAARDGRALVDPRLRGVDADVRLPRTADEARTDVRYFAAQGRRIIVAGTAAIAAARDAGIAATSAPDVPGALATVTR
jgi:hypothetical protein